MDITKSILSSYILGKTIGKGTFGKVKVAIHRKTNEPVAIKILEKDKIKDVTDVERVSRELHILKIARHSSIAQMYEVIETTKDIFIVMEFAKGGQFFDYVMDAKVKNQNQAHFYLVQIIQGLEYLHNLKVCHRDIKPENILLDSQNRLKIVDFGLSNMYKNGEKLQTACGSPCYASPEMIRGENYDPELTDVWSLGIVLFSMIFAKLPFQDENTGVLYSKIKSGMYVIDRKITPQLKDLLSKMLCTQPNNRYTLKKIKQHPWYRDRKIHRCFGIFVGYQSIPVDEEILKQLELIGYEEKNIRRLLENNVHCETTAAYYLLLKKKFKQSEPSIYDICNQKFNPECLMPKIRKSISQAKKLQSSVRVPTNKSFDYHSLYPENQLDGKKKNLKKQIKQNRRYQSNNRNCTNQVKSYDGNLKDHPYLPLNNPRYRKNRTSLSRSSQYQSPPANSGKKKEPISRNNYILVRNKTEEKEKLLKVYEQKKIKPKVQNIAKQIHQDNISINIYINNSKVDSPKIRKSSDSNQKKKKREKFTVAQPRLQPRLQTEPIDQKRIRSKQKVNKQKQLNNHEFVSNKISLQGQFWKKKSINSKTRGFSIQAPNERYSSSKRYRK